MFDLGKSTDGMMKLEQETDHLNITFFLGLTPRVWLYCESKNNFIALFRKHFLCKLIRMENH